VAVPDRVRVAFAHAALQSVADIHAIDVLHIKGTAVDPALGRPRAGGTDADVLVRPRHVEELVDRLLATGWQQRSTFASDNDFGSALTLQHPQWGFADVHRFFPGIGAPAATAFQRLWRDRTTRTIAGIDCEVPDLTGQSLILILNAARGMTAGGGAGEVAVIWGDAPPERRDAISALVTDLRAEVAFAAATGGLERYRHRRDYDLWRIESRGGTRVGKWVARVKAAHTFREAVGVVARAPLVNGRHLAFVLGREPTRRDVAREFFARPWRGAAETLRSLGTRRRRRP
jgi:hypothetical protein